MNTVSLSTNSLSYANRATSFVVHDQNQQVESKAERHQHGKSSIVTISSESRELLAQEQRKIANQLTERKKESETQEADSTSENKEIEQLDKLIERIKEQIKEVQHQIAELKNDNSEQAEQELKALEAQLGSLNATLLGLMGKKLKAVEESAPANA